MIYRDELSRAMQLLANDSRVVFVGQGVGCKGTGMSFSFDGIKMSQRIEFPVAEDLQMGFCIGLSLQGFIPVCVFPRWNFVLCAANQLVNHLDRLPIYSKFRPRVIIRVATPSKYPFNPQSQHDDDFMGAFFSMFRTLRVGSLITPDQIVPKYQEALEYEGSTLVAEFVERYKMEVPVPSAQEPVHG